MKKKSKTIKMRCLICRKLTLSLKTRKHMCMCIMKKNTNNNYVLSSAEQTNRKKNNAKGKF